MHPEPRRRSRHSRGEKYVLAGKAGQNMILSFSAGCGRRNSARRALPGESVGRKGGLGPSGLFAGCRPDLLGVPYRASPLDGRCWRSCREAPTTATKCFLPQTLLPQNAHPNQGTYMGHETAQPPPRCAPPRQNQRASSERAIKKGGAGALPRDSLRPGFL